MSNSQNSSKSISRKKLCFGVDIGSKTVSIAKGIITDSSSQTSPIVLTITDNTGSRIIPNQVCYPSDCNKTRLFGNEVSAFKTHAMTTNIRKGAKYHDTHMVVDFFGKTRPIFFPNFVNSIVSHVKDIINNNVEPAEEPVRLVYVSSQFDVVKNSTIRDVDNAVIKGLLYAHIPKNKTFDSANIDFSKIDLIDVDDVTALIGAYIQRYVLENSFISQKPVNCVIIDFGASKVQMINFVVIKMSNNEICVKIVQHEMFGDVTIDQVDDEFEKRLIQKILKQNPQSWITKVPKQVMRATIKKIRHDLSANQSISSWISIPEADIKIDATREELNDVLSDSGYMIRLRRLISKITLDNLENVYLVPVGGGCRIVQIDNLIKEFLKLHDERITLLKGLHPDESVSIGASFIGCVMDSPNLSIIYSRPVDKNIKICTNDKVVKTYTKDEYITTVIGKYDQSDIDRFKDNIILISPSIKTREIRCDNDDSSVSVYISQNKSYKIVVDGMSNRILYDKLSIGDNSIVVLNKKEREGFILTDIFQSQLDSEIEFLEMEESVKLRHNVINSIEEYYNDIDTLIHIIAKIFKITHILPHIDDLKKIKSNPLELLTHIIQQFGPNELVSPVKELHQFYIFCDTYLYDPELSTFSDNEKKNKMEKQNNIKSLIQDVNNVKKIMEAIEIVNNYKKFYK